jgi:PPM family protein phosphatase
MGITNPSTGVKGNGRRSAPAHPPKSPLHRLFATGVRRCSILAGVRHGQNDAPSHRLSEPTYDATTNRRGCNLVTLTDQIEHAILTDVGVRRSHNQDNYAVLLASGELQFHERGHLYVVADGMGAHAVGEKASEQAAAVIPHTYHKHAEQGPAAALRKAFIEANASIHTCGQQNPEFEGMGTTTTALLLRPEGAWLGHVGDSRAYRIRDGKIEQLTYDHSLVWEYARRQRIDPHEIKDIPSNVIIRCLGPEPLVQVDVEGPHPLRPGDIYLLCSDGLSGQVNDSEIGAVASALPPAEACRFLVDLANLRGGPDNTTVLIVRIHGNPENNGVVLAPLEHARPMQWFGSHWWLTALFCGTLLTLLAILLTVCKLTITAVLTFLLAVVVIVPGFIGLFLHYRREKESSSLLTGGGNAKPHVYRTAPCRIEEALLDKLAKAVAALHQQAGERHWDPNWVEYEQHHKLADDLKRQGDLPAAFREYCRAMLPLTQALGRHRNKEESFQPVWDKG